MNRSSQKPVRVGFDVTSATSRRPRGIAGYICALLLTGATPRVVPVAFLAVERVEKETGAAREPRG